MCGLARYRFLIFSLLISSKNVVFTEVGFLYMSVHAGHRLRLKKRFLLEGLEHFEKHNILELLLFFAIPQGDTNVTAHNLLSHFGSIRAVLDAPYDELVKIKGIGEHGATLIKLIPAIARTYMSESSENSAQYLCTTEARGNYLLPRYFGVLNETVYLLCLDNKGKPLGCSLIFEGSINSSQISLRKIVQTALAFNATCAVISHNHPNGIALPSQADLLTTLKISEALQFINVELIDHILIADGDFISFNDSGFLHK